MSGPKHNKALELLQAGVAELMNSESWRAALEFRAKLYRYSFNNAWLIYAQRPDATMVAGFHRWKELGRHVKKGEKGIAILAPIVRKIENQETGEETRRVVAFKTAYVFDLAQTEGEPVPEPPRPSCLPKTARACR